MPARCWGGDYVFFHPLSGDTHILDIVAGEVLTTLLAAPARESALRERIAGLLEVPADERVAQHLRGILGQLDELGLIEPVRDC